MMQLATGSNNGFADITQKSMEYHYEHTRRTGLQLFYTKQSDN